MAQIAAATRTPSQQRMWFLDNLKIVLIVLVIFHHTGQAYGPTGGFWYFLNPDRWPYLGFFFWFNASFFMGLFFFISAYFMPGSYERNGTRKFLADRLVRFGIPFVLFVMLVNPVMMYLYYTHFQGGALLFGQYLTDIYLGMGTQPAGWVGPWPHLHFGHLWFVQHLLVYAICYAMWRFLWKRPARPAIGAPSNVVIFGYTVGLVAVSMVVRIWFPIDRWIAFLGFIQVEPAHLPQYLSLFVLGTVAFRKGWLSNLPAQRGFRWLWTGLAAGAVGFGAYLLSHFGAQWGLNVSHDVLDMVFLVAECFVAVGMSVGLTTLFRERWNTTGPLGKTLAADAFAAYLVHFPVVVAVQFAADPLPFGALVKFLVVGSASVVGSFALGHVLRKVPGAKAVL